MLQALQTNIQMLAKLDIRMAANRIEISAKEEVVVNGGGSYTRWNAGGIESGTSGTWVTHAATHRMDGPKRLSQMMQEHPQPRYNDPYVLTNALGEPLPETRVLVKREDGSTQTLTSDAQGRLPELRSLLAEGVQLQVLR